MQTQIPEPEPSSPAELVRQLWTTIRAGLPFLIRLVGVFIVIGLSVAFLSGEEFESESRLMPELQAKAAARSQQFGALAELAGIDLGSSLTVEAVRPDLYPDVLSSTPFLLFACNQPVTDRNRKRYLLQDFLLEKEGKLTPANRILPTMNRPLVQFNKEQENLLKDIKERLTASLDKKSGIIYVKTTMPDPAIAAQFTQLAVTYLQTYVSNYRTGKVRQSERFLARQVREAKARYQQAELAWSMHADQNRFVVTKVADINSRRLEADYIASQTLYNDLNRQLEQTRLRVQEETPIFQVLEPPRVPVKRSSPRRTLLVLGAALLGGIVGISWLLVRKIFVN